VIGLMAPIWWAQMAGVGRAEVGAGRLGFARHPIPNELAPHHSESNGTVQ